MSQWIAQRIPRAPYDEDSLGMWAIVDDGRRLFGLEGDALASFIRTYIYELMDAGYKPVIGVGKNEWQLQVQYGSIKQDVAEAVIMEWLREGAKTPEPWTGLWFGLPRHWLPENRR
jgi:hypothetical protein